jgi:hypothetical protein
VLSFVHLVAIADFAEVDRVGQQSVQRGFLELTTTELLASLGDPALRSPTSGLDGFESSNEYRIHAIHHLRADRRQSAFALPTNLVRLVRLSAKLFTPVALKE